MKADVSMNISWKLGPVGPMLFALNYTWVPVAGLGLALLVSFWLPHYVGSPIGSPPAAILWLFASLTLIFYVTCLAVAEAVRTRVAGIYSSSWPRSVHLFPFGAAGAYPLNALSPNRAAITALAAPMVLGLLSLGFWGLSAVADVATSVIPESIVGVLRALAIANAGAALLGLLPGLPLACPWPAAGGSWLRFAGSDRDLPRPLEAAWLWFGCWG